MKLWFLVLLGLGSMGMAQQNPVQQENPIPAATDRVILGKQGMLFYADEVRLREHLTVFEANLNNLRIYNEWLRKKQVDLRVVVIPAKFRIYRENLPNGIDVPPEIENRFSDALHYFEQHQIHHVNLAPLMLDLKRQQGSFLPLDTHWTYQALDRVAEALAKDLQSMQGLKSNRYERFLTERAVDLNDEVIGYDLYKMLSEEQKVHYVPQGISVISAQSTGEGDLLSDESPDVTVVGSSYSNMGLANLMGYHSGKDILDESVRGGVFIINLLKYTRSAGFKQHPPKVLYLELPELHLSHLWLDAPTQKFVWGLENQNP